MCNENLYLVFKFIKKACNNKKLTRAHGVREHSKTRCSGQQASHTGRESKQVVDLAWWRLYQADRFLDSPSY